MLNPSLLQLIELALEEDLGRGDPTSEIIFPAGAPARGALIAKQKLVLSGVDVARQVFLRVGPSLRFIGRRRDGEELERGEVVAEIAGEARALLGAERTALNFLQHLSGVATLARAYARAVEGTGARIVDTRKTLPGWRALEKAATRDGGARNHRADLASGILIKDNHVAACGSTGEAVRRAKAGAPHLLKVQVEVSTVEQLDEALAAGADALLLDNVSPAAAAELVRRTRQFDAKLPIEASGNMRLDTVRAYAEAGVDLISVGALTHSAVAVDLSLEVELETSRA